jgi:hypothetical protein
MCVWPIVSPRCCKIPNLHAAFLASDCYSALPTAVLFVDAVFILWAAFGALLTCSRPILCWLHIASLVWGILPEVLPRQCPLTVLEDWLEKRAGIEPYRSGLLLHYLDKLVYPDISANVLTTSAVIVCVLSLVFRARQLWIRRGLMNDSCGRPHSDSPRRRRPSSVSMTL